MSIALCFLVTKNIQNIKVWQKWWKGHEDKINIYSHFSKKGAITQPEILDNRVKAVPTRWGDISLINAEAELYKKALKNKRNKKFILLSETCIPVRSFDFVYKKMMKNPDKGFLPYRYFDKLVKDSPIPFREEPECIDLLEKYDFFKYKLMGCDQWKVFSRRNATDFLEMMKDKVYFKLFSAYCIDIVPDSLAPDELMYINWIRHKYGHKGFKKYVKNILVTYVDFKGKAIHPINYRQLTAKTQDEICSADAMFARKFVNSLENRLLKQMPVDCI